MSLALYTELDQILEVHYRNWKKPIHCLSISGSYCGHILAMNIVWKSANHAEKLAGARRGHSGRPCTLAKLTVSHGTAGTKW